MVDALLSTIGIYPILVVVAVVVVLALLVWALDILAARVERQEEETRRREIQLRCRAEREFGRAGRVGHDQCSEYDRQRMMDRR